MAKDLKKQTNELPSPLELGVKLVTFSEKTFKSPCIGSVDEVNHLSLLTFIYMLITTTFIKCGQAIEADKIEAASNMLTDELVEDYPYLTIKEIEIAFKNGYKENYGEYFGLNVLTFMKWIKFFIKNERQINLKKLKLVKPLAITEITASAKEIIIKKAVISCFNSFYHTKGKLPFAYIHIYKYLESNNLFNYSESDELNFLSIAKSRLKSKFNPLNAKGLMQKSAYKRLIDSIVDNDHPALDTLVQELKLRKYFNFLIENKINIKKELK